MELTKELKEKVGKAESMEEEKKTGRSPQVGEDELDAVSGGAGETCGKTYTVIHDTHIYKCPSHAASGIIGTAVSGTQLKGLDMIGGMIKIVLEPVPGLTLNDGRPMYGAAYADSRYLRH